MSSDNETRARVLDLYATTDLNGSEIAFKIGVSRQRVSQILRAENLPPRFQTTGLSGNKIRLRLKRPKLRPPPQGVVYFVRRKHDGFIKIGYSSRLSDRLQALRALHGEVEFLAAMAGDRATERFLHHIFSIYRRDGEWFVPNDALQHHILSLPPVPSISPVEIVQNTKAEQDGEGISTSDIVLALRDACQRAGGQSVWAANVGLSGPYVSDVLNGRREPGASIARALGYKKVVYYTPDHWEARDATGKRTDK